MYVKVMMYNIRSGAIQWQIYDFFSDGNNNNCSISHRLQDICKTKYQHFDLEMKVKEYKNGTCDIRLEMLDTI